MKTKANSTVLSLDKTKQKKVAKQTKQLKKKIQTGAITIKEERKTLKITAEQKRGLIFISHLPHGFYEEQLKGYFLQFGKVTNVKVCRSGKSGRSKGYGYVEFVHPEVAKIAAETMNNYLMFKKRLIAEYVPYEKRPIHLFHGKSSSPTKYSAMTRRIKQAHCNDRVDEKTQRKRTANRMSKLNKKLRRLNQLGIHSEFIPVDVKDIKREKGFGDHLSNGSSLITSESETENRTSRRSLKRSVSTEEVKPSRTMLLSKSLDTVQTILSLDTAFKDSQQKSSAVKANKATSTSKIKLAKKGLKGVSKRKSKRAGLNAVTIKKIARELIRKKGASLLAYPSASRKTAKAPSKRDRK